VPLLDLEALLDQYDFPVGRVLHVGAHLGQEAAAYLRLGARDVTWVEANPAMIPALKAAVEPLGQRVVMALASDRSGDVVDFYITNNEQSSSMLRLGTHRYEHPEVVVTESVALISTTLDDLCDSEGIESPDLLALDIQGAELLALQGAERTLSTTSAIYTEVNERPLYDGACLLPQLDGFLHGHGFERVATMMTINGWGDALYLRTDGTKMTSDGQRNSVPSEYEWARQLRARVGTRARAIVSGAVGPRFDAVDAELERSAHRMSVIEQMLVHQELEIAALRQQVDECLDFLRLQQSITRELVEQLDEGTEVGKDAS
jgi:FkbM family methyltransferase